MAWVAAAAAVAGAAIAAYGAVSQSKYQKKMAEYNENQAQKEAELARQKAAWDAETSAKQWKVLLGKQKALYAKAGVDLSEGSPLLVMSYQAQEAERDRQAILYQGKTAEQSALDRAAIFSAQGNYAQTSGYISAGSTLLSSLGSAYSSYNRYKTSTNDVD